MFYHDFLGLVVNNIHVVTIKLRAESKILFHSWSAFATWMDGAHQGVYSPASSPPCAPCRGRGFGGRAWAWSVRWAGRRRPRRRRWPRQWWRLRGGAFGPGWGPRGWRWPPGSRSPPPAAPSTPSPPGSAFEKKRGKKKKRSAAVKNFNYQAYQCQCCRAELYRWRWTLGKVSNESC